MAKEKLIISPHKYGRETTVISLRITKDMLKAIDNVAAQTGRTRNPKAIPLWLLSQPSALQIRYLVNYIRPEQLPVYCLRGYGASEFHGSQPHDHLLDNSHACACHIHYNGENHVAPLPRESGPKTP